MPSIRSKKTLSIAKAGELGLCQPTYLEDVFSIEGRYSRSVNLERDFRSGSALDGYICSDIAVESLRRVITTLVNDIPTRAWTLIGPFGGGKSSFALFLSRMLYKPTSSDALKILRQSDPQLAKRVTKADMCYEPVLVSGIREPLGTALLRGLFALDSSKISKGLQKELKAIQPRVYGGEFVDSDIIIRLYKDVLSNLRTNGTGLLLVIDELGKVLEYTANHPQRSDIFLLQQMADLANSRDDIGFAVITILHQNFDAYARSLPETQRQEWAKVQGRYEDISFVETREQVAKLVGYCIQHDENQTARFDQLIKVLTQGTVRFAKSNIRSTESARIVELATSAFPLHPLTVLVLPSLFKKIGQNQRSLFSFLASTEPDGFIDFLRRTQLSDPHPVLHLPMLFDYIKQSLSSTMFDSTQHTWSQIETALDRAGDCTPVEVEIIKSIGVLTLAGEAGAYRPSESVIVFALEDRRTEADVKDALRRLAERSILIYRRYRDSYALWEGSDIDLEELIEQGRSHIQFYESLTAFLHEERFLRPVAARKHWLRTGTLRYFDVRVIDHNQLSDLIHQPRGQAVGIIAYVLYEHPHEAKAVITSLKRGLLGNNDRLVVAVPSDTKILGQAIYDYECLKWVLANAGDLERDPVAKRELKNRLAGAEEFLRQTINNTFGTGVQDRECSYWVGSKRVEIGNYRDIINLASVLCDRIYPSTPILRNEIVNRERLSPIARKARNLLVEAIILRTDQDTLGIEGYPPEKSIYFSLLKSTSLHRYEGGKWGVYPPLPTVDPGVNAVWGAMDNFFSSTEDGRRSLSELFAILREEPFGLAQGVIPILVCAALSYFDTEVALYEDGTFQPALTSPIFEKITINPSRFTIRRCRIAGPRSEVFTHLSDLAGTNATDGDTVTVISVLRPLLKLIAKLPEYSKRTGSLTLCARKVRDVIARANEPDVLLFRDLPIACGFQQIDVDTHMPPDEIAKFVKILRQSIAEIESSYELLLDRLERMILDIFGVGRDYELGRASITHRADIVAQYAVEPRLKDFAMRLANEHISRGIWIESIGSLLTSRKCAAWSDTDIEVFEVEICDLHRLFVHREAILFERHSSRSATADTVRIAITTLREAEIERVVNINEDEQGQVSGLEAKLRDLLRATGAFDNPNIALAALSKITRDLLD